MDFFKRLFSTDGFMPQGMCYEWNPVVICLHVISDGLITLVYYSIPLILFYFVRKRKDLPFSWIFVCFTVFIAGSGTTHLIEIWNIWHPVYRLSGAIEAVTAIVSIITAILLVNLIPQALSLPSPNALKKAHEAVLVEISERKKAEEALLLFNSVVLQDKESILITNAELDVPGPKIVFVNPAFTRMTGYTAEEVREKTPRILQGARTDKIVLGRLRESLARGETFEGEAINYRKDGTPFELACQIAPIRNSSDTITHFVAIQRDITEHKRTEERLRRLMDSNVHGVIFWNRKGQITEANDAFLRLVLYTREDLETGRISWAAMTPPEFAELDRRALEKMSKTGASTPCEKEFIRKDGSRAPVLVGAATLEDNSEEGVCFVLDLTERKQLEAQLFQAQKIETIGKLAGGVAHEFNSILTAIIGQTELLLDDLPMEEPLAKSAIEIKKAAGRAATLTRQLLAYGRKQILQTETLDLNSILVGMESHLHHLMGRDTEVHLAPAPGLKTVKVDIRQIEEVIMNMALNAHDAMPKGGKLSLETANVSFDQQSLTGFLEMKPGHYVMLAITDTGIGMSAEVQSRVFEPFFFHERRRAGIRFGIGHLLRHHQTKRRSYRRLQQTLSRDHLQNLFAAG